MRERRSGSRLPFSRNADEYDGLRWASNPLTLLFGSIPVPQDEPIDIGTPIRTLIVESLTNPVPAPTPTPTTT